MRRWLNGNFEVVFASGAGVSKWNFRKYTDYVECDAFRLEF